MIGGIRVKVFLSHSSKDKEYIRPIAQLFGADRCIFDELTFEAAMKNIDEIFDAMDNTDIFVYFISNESLNSEWVKKELNLAREKLSNNNIKQIFPLIIDPEVNYDDERIAEFLKYGNESYNLRHINNPKLAYKKISSQLIKLQMDKDINYEERKNFFYGRDIELKKFKNSFDDIIKKPIKCLVISGIEGVGRRTYAREALKSAKIIKNYYFPSSISLKRSESIEDMILKISDLGFGDYTLEKITSLINMDEKINALTELLKEAQKYKEHIFVDDDRCLVGLDQNMPYWFERTLEKLDNNIVITIVTLSRLDISRYKSKEHIFSIELDSLEKSEYIGLLRAYSEFEGISLDREDLIFLKDCLNGYPPQIKFCVDLIKESGIEYVKNESYKLYNFVEEKATSILDVIIDEKDKEISMSFLSFLCNCDTVPVTLIYEIKRLSSVYEDLLIKFLNLSICRYMGSSKEYLKVNTVIQDYIQRQKLDIPKDIQKHLETKVDEFNSQIDNSQYTDLMDFAELGIYIKENIKKGEYVPQKFLYSTVFLKTIIELYNNRKIDKVISIVQGIKEDGTMERFDFVPQSQIQYYYCEALARKQKTEFYNEVEYFKVENKLENYNFLKGFNYRIAGKLEYAEICFKDVLKKKGRHSAAKRELVTIYRLLDEYDTAYNIARDNYKEEKKNIFHIQSYFDCLIRKQELTEREKKDIEDILDIVEKVKGNKEKEMYYQIRASYLAYHEKEYENAVDLLNNGLKKNPGAIYLAKEIFDINERFKKLDGMEDALINLEKIIKDGRSGYKNILIRRKAILDAYKGKDKNAIEIYLRSQQGKNYISENFLQGILRKVSGIK